MRQQLGYAPDITLVDEAGATGTRVAFDLAVLVAEIVATISRVPLEALRCLAKTLRRGPVGFQLGHFNSYLYGNPFASCCAQQPLPGEPATLLRSVSGLLLFRCKDHDHLLAFH